MDIEEVKRLAVIAHEKRQRVEMLGMLNVQTDPDKRKEQVVNYEVAIAERAEADANLRKAQGL